MEKSLTPFLRVVDLRVHHIGPIRFDLAAGECIGLRGPSGAGKSLLLRAVADLEPHTGVVLLDGVAQQDMHAPEWRRQVALLPAESVWWTDTVGDHFTNTDTVQWRRVGFDAQVSTWPVARLSSGERQRLALLRLLENRPRILLLDEPTANLDDSHGARIEELVRSYRAGTGAGVLWVGHHIAQLQRVADRTVVMNDGRLNAGEGAR